MVITSAFWLNGRLDPTCVSAGNCEASDIRWEDEGPGFNASIYEGWMGIEIDNLDRPCLMVFTSINILLNIFHGVESVGKGWLFWHSFISRGKYK